MGVTRKESDVPYWGSSMEFILSALPKQRIDLSFPLRVVCGIRDAIVGRLKVLNALKAVVVL